MAGIALRAGLWGLVLVLALFLIADSQGDDGLLAQLAADGTLVLVAEISAGLLVLGAIMFVAQRMRFSKARCKVCGVKVDSGYIYCRRHLNTVIEKEDLRQRTLNVRRPDV